MHTIALVTQKGGSGKSTLATSLALAARQAGHTVCLIDTDPLGTLTNWQRRRGRVAPLVETVLNAREIEQRLESLEQRGVTVAIVDTPSGLSAASTAAVRHSNLCMIPARPSIADIEASALTLSVVRAWKKRVRLHSQPDADPRQSDRQRGDDAERRCRLRSRRRGGETIHRDAQRSPGRTRRGSLRRRIRPAGQVGRGNPQSVAVDGNPPELRRGRGADRRTRGRGVSDPVAQTRGNLRTAARLAMFWRRGPAPRPRWAQSSRSDAQFTSGISGTRRSSGRSG